MAPMCCRLGMLLITSSYISAPLSAHSQFLSSLRMASLSSSNCCLRKRYWRPIPKLPDFMSETAFTWFPVEFPAWIKKKKKT